jgi:pimeloyl-ACP methyl ester carboxylesterase/ketosteroid isomerase-like protein
MRIFAALLALFLSANAFADAVEDVRQAELAFAKAFVDRDKDTFFSFLTDDATFLSSGATLRGKVAVIETWSRYFTGPVAPFAWAPDRVTVSLDGTLGLSSGPVFDPMGNHAGSFMSTWRKQPDGKWKIVFDGSGPGPSTATVEEGDITTPDGVKLHYRKVGRGPVVIAPFDLLLFDSMKQFADIATVITYDMRNRGRSSRAADTASWTMQQEVQDLETVRAHFKAETFVPVGFSYLGKMVMLYAADHPTRVRRIIQLGPLGNAHIDGGVGDSPIPADDLQRLQKMTGEGAAEKSPREFCVAQWNALRYMLVGDPKKAPRVTVDEMCALENEWPVNVNKVFERLLSGEPRRLSEEELKKIAVPVLTIHGTKDRNSPYDNGRNWATQLPNARLITLEGAAHALWLDDPVTTYAAMRAFLRGEWPLGSANVKPAPAPAATK